MRRRAICSAASYDVLPSSIEHTTTCDPCREVWAALMPVKAVKQAPPMPYSRMRDRLNSCVSLCGGIIGVCSSGVGRRRLLRRFSQTSCVQEPFMRPSSPKPAGSHRSIASSCLPGEGPRIGASQRLPGEVPRDGNDGGHGRITAGNDDATS